MGQQIPIVDYLVLDDGDPYLEANVCVECAAHYFDRRNACANCGGLNFRRERCANTGQVQAFTIVHRAAKGVPTPYVSAIVNLDDANSVKANIVDVEASPDAVSLGMPVTMTTFVAGSDDDGTEAIAFGYRPASGANDTKRL